MQSVSGYQHIPSTICVASMLKTWAYCTLIMLAHSGTVAGDISWSDEATSPTSSRAQSIAGTRVGKSSQAIEGLDLAHVDVRTDRDPTLFTAIPPVSKPVVIAEPKVDSVLPEGEAWRLSRVEVVDHCIKELAFANSIYFYLSRAPRPAWKFGNKLGSIDLTSRLVSGDSIPETSSMAFLGMSRRWVFIVSAALFFTLTTIIAIFLISHAPVIEFDDPPPYRVDGPRPTKLGRQSDSQRHRLGHQRKRLRAYPKRGLTLSGEAAKNVAKRCVSKGSDPFSDRL